MVWQDGRGVGSERCPRRWLCNAVIGAAAPHKHSVLTLRCPPVCPPPALSALTLRMAPLERSAGVLLAAYLPSLPLKAVGAWLGFDNKKQAAAFVTVRNGVVSDGALDVRLSRQQQGKAG